MDSATEPTFHIGRHIPSKAPGTVRVAVISDTHGADPQLPAHDILIHIGGGSRSGHSGSYRVVVGATSGARIDDTLYLEGTSACIHGVVLTAVTRCGQFVGAAGQRDVLISAIPPYGVLDVDSNGRRTGSAALRYYIETTSPRVVVFGGNPCGHGAMWVGARKRTLCINAGIWSESTPMVRYGVPLVFDVPSEKRNLPRRPYLG